MLNTASSARVRRQTRHTWHGALAGLMIGSAVLASAMLLAGCSGAAASSSASSSGARERRRARLGGRPAPPAEAGGAAQQPSSTGTTTARLAPASDIIYTAQLTVQADSVNSAAAKAAQITQSAGGYVSNESTSADPDHPSEATASIQLKIPVPAYQATLSQLEGGLGDPAIAAAAGPGRHPAGSGREQPGHLG